MSKLAVAGYVICGLWIARMVFCFIAGAKNQSKGN